MKEILLAAFMASTLTIFAQSPESSLCKTWKVDIEAFVADLPQEMTAMFEFLPEDQKEMAMKQMTEGLKSLTVTFFKDGTMKSNSQEGEKQGTWKFIEDKKAVFTKVGDEEAIMDIHELTGDKMKVQPRARAEGEPITTMTFIPAN